MPHFDIWHTVICHLLPKLFTAKTVRFLAHPVLYGFCLQFTLLFNGDSNLKIRFDKVIAICWWSTFFGHSALDCFDNIHNNDMVVMHIYLNLSDG